MNVAERGFDIGDKLREVRRISALTQEELADLSGVHAVTISDIERHKQKASAKTLKKLAAALDVDIKEFTNGAIRD